MLHSNNEDYNYFILRLLDNRFNIKYIKDVVFLKDSLNPTVAILHEFIGTCARLFKIFQLYKYK